MNGKDREKPRGTLRDDWRRGAKDGKREETSQSAAFKEKKMVCSEGPGLGEGGKAHWRAAVSPGLTTSEPKLTTQETERHVKQLSVQKTPDDGSSAEFDQGLFQGFGGQCREEIHPGMGAKANELSIRLKSGAVDPLGKGHAKFPCATIA